MGRKRIGLLIGILVFVIIILSGVLSYTLLLRPSIDKYIFEKQLETYNQGIEDAVTVIMNDVRQNPNGITQLTLNNQTMVLMQVPVQDQQPQQ